MSTATLEPVTATSALRLVSLAEVQAAAALALGDADRVALLNELVHSLPEYDFDELPDDNSTESPPLSPAWIAEIECRSREIDEGLVTPVPYGDVMRRMRELCRD